MSSLLTIHLIIQNNENTIEHCLESLRPLNADLLVGDIGCKDKTIDICKLYDARIVRLSLNDDLSQVRNKMSEEAKSRWNIYIEPWETMLSGHQAILNLLPLPPNVYKISVLQGDVLTKQNRIWHKDYSKKFINPVYEVIPGEFQEIPTYISVGQHQDNLKLDLVKKWVEKYPLANEPVYYMACTFLAEKNWDSFINYANIYLHQEKTESATVFMTHYYCAMVTCYIKKDYQTSINHLIPCISKKPTMAEFWCLLGDCYYAARDYERATTFYENAIILGSRRLANDDYPMEISKYQEYPDKMIKACEQIKMSSRKYIGRN